MEIILVIISIVLFYLFTPGIIIKLKTKYLFFQALVTSIIFGIFISGILKTMKIKIENLDEDNEEPQSAPQSAPQTQGQNRIICKKTEVHNIKGDGPECVQCPVINGKQLVSFPNTVTTNEGTFDFDGYCGYANMYVNDQITTTISPNKCLHANDLPLKIPSYDPDLRFCLANPFGTKIPNGQMAPTITGDNKFNVIIPDIKNPMKLPFYFISN